MHFFSIVTRVIVRAVRAAAFAAEFAALLTVPVLVDLAPRPLSAQAPDDSLARVVHPPLFAQAAAPVAWGRYTHVAQCLVAASLQERVDAEAAIRRRGGEPMPEDSAALVTLDRDGTPPPRGTVNATARRCRTDFSAAQVASRELPELLRLALYAHDVPLADSVVAREVAELPTSSDRAHAEFVARLRADYAASLDDSMRVALADRLEQLIAARWPGAVGTRVALAGSRVMLELPQTLRLHVDTATNPVRMADLEAAVRPIMELARVTPSEPLTAQEQTMLRAAQSGAVLPAFLKTWVHVLEQLPRATPEVLRQLVADTIQADTTGAGAPPLPLSGQYWFRSGSPELRQGRPPLPVGHPTLVYLSDGADENFLTLLRFKRLQHAIPALELVIVAPLGFHSVHRSLRGEGNNRTRGIIGLVRDTASQMREAESIRQFFFDELGLRGTVMLDTLSQWWQVPAPDNRLRHSGWATLATYAATGWVDRERPQPRWLLLDGRGRVVLRGDKEIAPRVLAAIIRRLATLAAEPSAAATPSKP